MSGPWRCEELSQEVGESLQEDESCSWALNESKVTRKRKEQGEHSGRANIQGPGKRIQSVVQSEGGLTAGVALGQVGEAQFIDGLKLCPRGLGELPLTPVLS